MTCLDGLASLPQLSAYSPSAIATIKAEAISKLNELAPISPENDISASWSSGKSRYIQLGAFVVPRGPLESAQHIYNLQAPTTQDNAQRVIRACQVPKPILLEGSPGVGKTSLITAIANLCGYNLCRINLSDQTDLADLFGCDLPVEGGGPGEFAWKDAEFLRALQEGHWVLLDEMNLAPQAVLEGLNAILDHRGAVYIPELGRSFTSHPDFRIFAAQNPIQQGGGRKGLPKSFINRFTKVYVEALTPNDLMQICQHMFPDYPPEWLQSMITFNTRLEEEIVTKKTFARAGAPWEFNLRDVTRWANLLRTVGSHIIHPIEHVRTIYLSRLRSSEDRLIARRIVDDVFGQTNEQLDHAPYPILSPSCVQFGSVLTPRSSYISPSRPGRLLQSQLAALETMSASLAQGWLVILTGPRDSGKTSMTRFIANATGNRLQEVSINSATDTTDILGSFEQLDKGARVLGILHDVHDLRRQFIRSRSGLDYSAFNLSTATHHSSTDLAIQDAHKFLSELAHTEGPWAEEATALLAKLRNQASTTNGAGRFEWVDGPLVKALKAGYWILLDGANLCSPSVLDRLNSLCEPGGVLILSERGHVNGSVEVIRPHPNFRLFMSVDPQHGELSRAMRNRGIEICLSPERTREDSARVRDYHRTPLLHDGPQAVESESLRRGLAALSSGTVSPYWPPGLSMQDDTISSLILQEAASLPPSLSVSVISQVEDTLYSFALTTSSPVCTTMFSRLLLARPRDNIANYMDRIPVIFDSFRRSSLWRAINDHRRRSEQTRPVPFNHLSVQVSTHTQPQLFASRLCLCMYILRTEKHRSMHLALSSHIEKPRCEPCSR